MTDDDTRTLLVDKYGPEAGALFDAISNRLMAQFVGRRLTDETIAEMAEYMAPIIALAKEEPQGDLKVSSTPDGRFIIEGSGDYADWLRAAHSTHENRKTEHDL